MDVDYYAVVELLKSQEETARLRRKNNELREQINKLSRSNMELRENEWRLEMEADWLANNLAHWDTIGNMSGHHMDKPEDWRRAARKAVEEGNERVQK